ncbi:MAG: hypothetical protein ABIG69_12230 [Bacteroidota bacterium]
MKGQSDTNPRKFVISNGKTQVNYNIVSEVITDEHGTRTVWKYDVVEIEGKVTKAKVIEAMQRLDVESDSSEIIPQNISTQHTNAKSELALSAIANITYAQADNYIDTNVTDLASARSFLKKLTRVVLAILKRTE